MGNQNNNSRPLSPRQVAEAIAWLIAAGYTGDKAAIMIHETIGTGKQIIELIAQSTAKSMIERIDSDPVSKAQLQGKLRAKLEIFLEAFVSKAKELQRHEVIQ